jgi:glucose-6-phosphate dehydrogenase assembly protein OpcA
MRCCEAPEGQTVAAGHSVDVDPARWQELLDELPGWVASRLGRMDLRRRARAFVRGLPRGPAGWVAGDEVYGAGPGLRAEFEASGIG